MGQLWARTPRLHVYRQLVLLQAAQLSQALTKRSIRKTASCHDQVKACMQSRWPMLVDDYSVKGMAHACS